MMAMNRMHSILTAALFVAAIAAGCATIDTGGDITDYEAQVSDLQQKLSLNPSNAEALRDLAIIYFQTKRYETAERLLSESVKLDASDVKSQFYYGMTLESMRDTMRALAVYIRYTDFSMFSTYRNMMEGRYRALSGNVIKTQLRELLAREEQLGFAQPETGAIAVFPMIYTGEDGKYAPLGTGISELILTDLGQVQELKPVERIRLETLLDELSLGSSPFIDQSTAPRLGRLLRASGLVTGSYAVSESEALRIDVQPLTAADSSQQEPLSESGALADIFKLEKRIVFALLERLDIQPTPAEKERIEKIPTENLQAFLLYCIGLERENTKDFSAAKVYFDQSLGLDPGFTMAKLKSVSMQSVLLAGGTREQSMSRLYQLEPGIQQDPVPSANMIAPRLQTMSGNTGAGLLPGSGTRSPIEEAVRTGAGILGLPAPPAPPR